MIEPKIGDFLLKIKETPNLTSTKGTILQVIKVTVASTICKVIQINLSTKDNNSFDKDRYVLGNNWITEDTWEIITDKEQITSLRILYGE